MGFQKLAVVACLIQFLALSNGTSDHRHCKAVPGTKEWPSTFVWNKLNSTLSGHLIKPSPPGAICHSNQPTFDPQACPALQANWKTSKWHTENPISLLANNWVNDSCLPDPNLSCTGHGYPLYVVNATEVWHVKKGVDFARLNRIRLNVKGTGHDYLGRSAATNSLSIWTHNLRGLRFFDKGSFRPKGSPKFMNTAAITVGAGVQMLEIDEEAARRNLTIVSGGAGTVGVGGYLTGGGHGAFSSTFGLGADQIVEFEIVTPTGDILTANECQNEDLFWAVRGGGGSTFGVLTSVTIKAYPSFPMAQVTGIFGGPISLVESYWDAISTILSHYPSLSDHGISAYTWVFPNVTKEFGINDTVNGFYGSFMLPLLHPENSTASLIAAVEEVFADAKRGLSPSFFSSVTGSEYPDFWSFYKDTNGPLDAGYDTIVGSRLLDQEALTGNRTALKEAFRAAVGSGSIQVLLVGGKGVQNADIPGGSNAVNPAWRKAYAHTIRGVSWQPFDAAEKKNQENLLTNTYIDALRNLAPNMGSYVNEADPHEPNFQHAFWGSNYERLLDVKSKVDPDSVLWCTPCVGNEGWKLDGDRLCKL